MEFVVKLMLVSLMCVLAQAIFTKSKTFWMCVGDEGLPGTGQSGVPPCVWKGGLPALLDELESSEESGDTWLMDASRALRSRRFIWTNRQLCDWLCDGGSGNYPKKICSRCCKRATTTTAPSTTTITTSPPQATSTNSTATNTNSTATNTNSTTTTTKAP